MSQFLAQMTARVCLCLLVFTFGLLSAAPSLTSTSLAAFASGSVLHLFDAGHDKTVALGDGYRPSWSPDGTRLVYASYRASNQDLYTFDLTTMTEQRITDDAMTDDNAVWSPAGDKIAYLSYRRGFGDIYLADLASGDNRAMLALDQNLEMPVWSPDGEYLAFSVQAGIVTDMMVYNVTTHESRYVSRLPQGYAAHPAWSPIENRLAFVASYNSLTELHLYDVGAQTGRIVLQTSGYWAYQVLNWSPDGTLIAMHCIHPNGVGSICTLNPDDGTLTDLITPVSNIWGVRWSPDGRWLAYTVGERLTGRTWLIDMTTGEQRQAVPQFTDSSSFAWQPFPTK
jgi:TolB protein